MRIVTPAGVRMRASDYRFSSFSLAKHFEQFAGLTARPWLRSVREGTAILSRAYMGGGRNEDLGYGFDRASGNSSGPGASTRRPHRVPADAAAEHSGRYDKRRIRRRLEPRDGKIRWRRCWRGRCGEFSWSLNRRRALDERAEGTAAHKPD